MSDDRHEAYRETFTRTRIKEIIDKIHPADLPHYIYECVQDAIHDRSNPNRTRHLAVKDVVQRVFDEDFKNKAYNNEG